MTRVKFFCTAICAASFSVGWTLAPARAQDKVVNLYGYGDYVDPRVLQSFSAKTGITVTYNAYDAGAAPDPRPQTGNADADVVIVSGRDLQKQIAAGLYLKLDKSRIPNSKTLWPDIMKRLEIYDPGNQYAVNYMWFTAGIAYDANKVSSAVTKSESWGILFRPENLKGFLKCGVGVMDSPEDVFAITSQYLWSDWRVIPSADRQTNLKRAFDLFGGILDNVKKYSSASYADALARGSMCLAVGYSMDSFRARDQAAEAKNGIHIDYIIPKEGAPIFLDNLAIPKNAPHVDAAYALIDFLLRPEIAAKNTSYIGVANGVLGSKQFVDKSISSDKSIYPDATLMNRLFVPASNDSAVQKTITQAWARVKPGK